MLWLAIFVLTISAIVDDRSVGETTDQLVKRFLPQNAKVETLRTFDPTTKTETKVPAASVGRMDGKGNKFLAFVYSTNDAKGGQHLRLRVVQNPESRSSILDQRIPGTFLWMQDFKTNGFQILDLDGDGCDEIVTITSEGASLGAYLNVFTIRRGRLESILDKPGGLEVDGYRFRFELGPYGKYVISTYGKAYPAGEVYGWDGRKFKRIR